MIIYSINEEFQAFLDRCESESAPRGLKVRESLLESVDLIPTKTIANFENRPFNFKYFCGELAWYLSQDNDIEYIGQFSNFWKNITNPGTNQINSNYGSLLFGDQLSWCLESLRKDINTRQAIAFLNQPKFQFEGNKDFVCTMYINFFIRNNKLNMKVQMRSNDIFYGLTYDAAFFAFVHQHMYLWLKSSYPNLELGTYTHFADNIHFYEHHFELASKIKNENTHRTMQYDMNIESPLFSYAADNYGKLQFSLTQNGTDFIDEINSLSKKEAVSSDYKNILSNYLNIGVHALQNTNV
jgi:thymidylate synthase